MTSTARIAASLLGLGALVVVAFLLLSGSDGYIAKVELQNAYGVRKNNSVKIAGANGGKIKDIEVTDKDTALVTMQMKKDVKFIGEGASVTTRPTDLLGERYIALDPGDLSKPVDSGTTIPLSKTSAPVELDDIVNLFQPDVRGKLRILINELGVALGGRGTDFNKLLDELPNSLDKARTLVDEVADENVALERLIVDGDTFLAKVNSKRDEFGRLLDEGDRALTTIADKREALGATLRSAPGALSQLQSTLGTVESASASLGPAADSLRRTAAPLTRTLRNVRGFQESATDTLEAATKASPALRRLAAGARSPIRDLRPTANDAKRILDHSNPTLDTLDRRGSEDLMWTLQNFARWFRPRDGLTHQVEVNLNFPPTQLFTILDDIGKLGSPAKQRSKQRSAEPKQAAPAPEPRKQQDSTPAPTPKRKLELPKIKLPKLTDLPKTLDDVDKGVKKNLDKVEDGLRKNLDKVEDGVKGTLDGLGRRLGSDQQQQRKENSDAMGLFDYLFAP